MKKIILFLLVYMSSMYESTAQIRPFSDWESIAFCSYTRYHPFRYINADNNWEIIMALREPNTKSYLDSIGIKSTASQLMLLQIEGLISREKDNKWVTTIPLFDSLQTVDARRFSRTIAEKLYPQIKNSCSALVSHLSDKNMTESAFTILFSYILDGRVWDLLGSFEDVKSSATWDGECWALYSPRKFSCGTNTFDDHFSVCWTDKEPDFIKKELNVNSFIKPLIEDYKKYGKITTSNIRVKAENLGIGDKNGFLLIPVIDSKNEADSINIVSNQITRAISRHFTETDIIPLFQDKFGIGTCREELASTILYHEVMWDLMDLIIEDKIVNYPLVWRDKNAGSTYSVILLQK